MTLQTAIEKAIEQGYERPEPCEIEGIEVYHKGDTLLDPSFWQCLGRSMGWNGKHYSQQADIGGELVEVTKQGKHKCWDACSDADWKTYWHRFIDHLAEGKSIEDYFKTL